MNRPSTVRNVRRVHRILGLVLGLQFLAWTISGLYFSWSDLDHIHGDAWIQDVHPPTRDWEELRLPLAKESSENSPQTLELVEVLGEPFWWVNDHVLVDAQTGLPRKAITRLEAERIVEERLALPLTVTAVVDLQETGPHHEYRERPLPAWQVHLSDGTHVYVDSKSGQMTRVRNSAWRVFDALWMFHTMDYATRDNFNNLLLRVFSLAGLVTVLSGLLLYGVTWRPRRTSP